MTVRRPTLAVVGATGRLGGLVASVVEELPEFELVARLSSKDGAHEAPPSVFGGAALVVDVTVPSLPSARLLSRDDEIATIPVSAALLETCPSPS